MAVTSPHPPGSMPPMKAMPHQERVADKLENSEDDQGLLAAHSVGTGKTFTAINASRRLNLPILAITPASLRTNFQKELDATGTTGSTVVSYEQALKRINNPAFTDLARKSLVVYDEAHNMGHNESARSSLTSLLPGKKLLLTGTPVRNRPHEIAPLINAASKGSLPEDEADFNNKFVATKEIPVGFWGRLIGAKPGIIHVPTHLDDFAEAIKGKVDFHENVDRSNFPSFSESLINVPMSPKQQAAYDFSIGKFPAFAYKIRHGIPPSKSEGKNLTAFLNGPRQISNHPGEFNTSATDDDAPKFKAAADEIEKRQKGDKNFRGVIYSTFLSAGMDPMSRELDRRGIKHLKFNGNMDDKEKKKAVEAYNKGDAPVMIISSAGAEGLDLKGTKLMQIMEPHWNEEKIDQVRGRAIRYRSHSHLPEEERHVEVQRFHAVPTLSFLRSITTGTPHGRGVDEYIYDMAKEKRELNQPFMDVLKREGGDGPEKKAGYGVWCGECGEEASMRMRDCIGTQMCPNGHTFLTPDQMVAYTKKYGREPKEKCYLGLEEDPKKAASILHVEFKQAGTMPVMSQLFPGDKSRRFDYSHELKELAMMKDAPAREAAQKQVEMAEKMEQKKKDDAVKAEAKAVADAEKARLKSIEKEQDRIRDAAEKERDREVEAQQKALDRALDFKMKAQERNEQRAFDAKMKAQEREDQAVEQEEARAQAEVDRAQTAADQALDALDRLRTGQAPTAAPAAEPEPAEPAKAAEWTSPANMAVHAQKHGDEFGGQDQYISAENFLSAQPPADLEVLNQRCQSPEGHIRPRCSTAYFSPSMGVVHVKDNASNKTISLYKRGRSAGGSGGPAGGFPGLSAIATRESFDPISGEVAP